MTLEDSINRLIAENGKLRESVEALTREYGIEFDKIRETIFTDFYVSAKLIDEDKTAFSDSSLSSIQAKIESYRKDNQNMWVTVSVESYTDTAPLSFSSGFVLWKFSPRAALAVTKPNPTGPYQAVLVSGESVKVDGLNVTYTNGNFRDDFLVSVSGRAVGTFELRNGTFVNCNVESPSEYYSFSNVSRGRS